MNTADIVILAVMALSVVYGVYHGFVASVFSLAATGLSVFCAFTFGPRAAEWISALPQVKQTLAGYTDAVVRVGDFDLAGTKVAGLTGNVVETVMKSVRLPEALEKLLRSNLTDAALADTGAKTVNEYVSGTIVSSAISVISFLAVFFAAYAVCLVVLGVIRNVMRFPLLKQADWLMGAVLGLVRGALIVYLVLLVLPLAETVLPQEAAKKVLEGSRLVPLFSSVPLFLRVALL